MAKQFIVDGVTLNGPYLARLTPAQFKAGMANNEGLAYAWRNSTKEEVAQKMTDLHALAIEHYGPKKPTHDNAAGHAKALPKSEPAPANGADNNSQPGAALKPK